MGLLLRCEFAGEAKMGLGPTQKQTIYGSYEFGIGVQHTNAELIEFVCLSCSRRSPGIVDSPNRSTLCYAYPCAAAYLPC